MTDTSPTAASAAEAADYRFTMRVGAPPSRIVAAVTDDHEIMRWWTAVSGSERDGDEVRLAMGGQWLAFTIGRPTDDEVTWSVTRCEMAPDWVGTTPSFAIRAGDDGTTELEFRHVGLVPELECFEMCRAGWGHFMPSLQRYLETGEGLPNEPRLVTT